MTGTRFLVLIGGLLAATALAACTQHTIKVEPIEVKPIHMTVDINIKVDQELDEFFDFEDGATNEGEQL